MAKIPRNYFQVDPWKIIENDYNKDLNQMSESIFSLGNEFMGARGFFEESVSAKSLIGTYFNGVYEYSKDLVPIHYKGIIKRTHFMINAVNFLYTRIIIDGEKLDLGEISYRDFYRELDLKNGLLTRKFVWTLKDSREIEVEFKRLLSMESYHDAYQLFTFRPLNFDGTIDVSIGLDFSIVHWGKLNYWNVIKSDLENNILIGKTDTNQLVLSKYSYHSKNILSSDTHYEDKLLVTNLKLSLTQNKSTELEKRICNYIDKEQADDYKHLLDKALSTSQESFLVAKAKNECFFADVWQRIDIEITGDEKNQQGIRYCLFQLTQTYHGIDETNNIGAKGLTGEAYSGHAFWDTETYCLPFYLFNNTKAAKNLLLFRYHTLDAARKRAIELDCKGACYPIATLNGYESCDLWQHASLQPQPSTAVAYAVFHYVKNTNDKDFLNDYGIEMLVEISRYLVSRGDFNATKSHFGFYGVMGPDEFQMMVNHNMYTNYMGKKTLTYTFHVLKELQKNNLEKYHSLAKRLKISANELNEFAQIAEKMYIIYDEKTQLFEQHMGYYELPHVDIHQIPVEDFPLYSHWSYDRIYRNDMIKQPDVLMAMFLYNSDFTYQQKKNNYEFYEPRCIHESSLSPSIHSIIAAEINKIEEAIDFFGFATRMDLDDYNRNTNEGLHTTSIAAAWVNIVYGFGGLRTDGDILRLSPKLPAAWVSYSFRLNYKDHLIKVMISKSQVAIELDKDLIEEVLIFGQRVMLKKGTNVFGNE